MEYVSTNEQLADMLTKALLKGNFVKLRDKLGHGTNQDYRVGVLCVAIDLSNDFSGCG